MCLLGRHIKYLTFPGGSDGKASAYNVGDRVRSLGREDPLEKEMATHCGTLAWEITWTEELSRLQPMWSQKVGHNWATSKYLGTLSVTEISNGSGRKNVLYTSNTFVSLRLFQNKNCKIRFKMLSMPEKLSWLGGQGVVNPYFPKTVVCDLEPDPRVPGCRTTKLSRVPPRLHPPPCLNFARL